MKILKFFLEGVRKLNDITAREMHTLMVAAKNTQDQETWNKIKTVLFEDITKRAQNGESLLVLDTRINKQGYKWITSLSEVNCVRNHLKDLGYDVKYEEKSDYTSFIIRW